MNAQQHSGSSSWLLVDQVLTPLQDTGLVLGLIYATPCESSTVSWNKSRGSSASLHFFSTGLPITHLPILFLYYSQVEKYVVLKQDRPVKLYWLCCPVDRFKPEAHQLMILQHSEEAEEAERSPSWLCHCIPPLNLLVKLSK